MTDTSKKPPTRPRRVTAKTVADLAGVSRSAVSRAFTPGAYLDSEKRRRILQIAADTGYQPNALAAGLKGGQSNLVAVFVGDMRSPYDAAFVGQLTRRLIGMRKWPILVDQANGQPEAALDDLLRFPLDALILRGGSMSQQIVERCARFNVSTISSGRPVEGRGVDTVCCRNADGLHRLTEVLVQRGYRRFGFLNGPSEFYSSSRRRAGVLQALTKARLPLVAEARGDYTVEGGHWAAVELLNQHRIDALICANDAMAIGALAAAQALSLDVPGDLAVTGFDDIDMAGWPIFNLTTVRNPIDQAVDAIIHLLDLRQASPKKAPDRIDIDPVVIERGTH